MVLLKCDRRKSEMNVYDVLFIGKFIFGGIVLGIVTDIIVQEWIFNKRQHEASVNMHKSINKMKVRK